MIWWIIAACGAASLVASISIAMRRPLKREAVTATKCGKCGYPMEGRDASRPCPECGSGFRCGTCGYSVTGLKPGGRCPECGAQHHSAGYWMSDYDGGVKSAFAVAGIGALVGILITIALHWPASMDRLFFTLLACRSVCSHLPLLACLVLIAPRYGRRSAAGIAAFGVAATIVVHVCAACTRTGGFLGLTEVHLAAEGGAAGFGTLFAIIRIARRAKMTAETACTIVR